MGQTDKHVIRTLIAVFLIVMAGVICLVWFYGHSGICSLPKSRVVLQIRPFKPEEQGPDAGGSKDLGKQHGGIGFYDKDNGKTGGINNIPEKPLADPKGEKLKPQPQEAIPPSFDNKAASVPSGIEPPVKSVITDKDSVEVMVKEKSNNTLSLEPPLVLDMHLTSPVFNPDNKGLMCIVLVGAGQRDSVLKRILEELDPSVTLAFYPWTEGIENAMLEARRRGHELLMMVPMEPMDYPANDPGPDTLLTGVTTAENLSRLERNLSPGKEFVGIMNYMGGRFTASPEHYEPVIRELLKRRIMLVDNGWAPRSAGFELAIKNRVPVVRASFMLDPSLTRDKLVRELDEFSILARQRGLLVIIGMATPVVVDALQEWTASIKDKPVALAPVSAAVLFERSRK